MFVKQRDDFSWSRRAWLWLVISTVATAVLCLVDGLFHAWQFDPNASPYSRLFAFVAGNFISFFEQGMFVSALLFVGARFFESRSLLTLGFDRADAEKIRLKGPDEENVVWIGRRYASVLEAEAVAEVAARKLKEDGGSP